MERCLGLAGVVAAPAARVLAGAAWRRGAQTPPSRRRRCTLPLPTPRPPHGRNIYCWLSSSSPTARPSYVMPGGAKKGKAESKDSPEKDKADIPPRPKQTGNGSPRTEVGAK